MYATVAAVMFAVSPCTTASDGVSSASATVARADVLELEIARLLEPAQAALDSALAREAELKDFTAWENVRALDARLRDIRKLQGAGNLADAYEKSFSYYTALYAQRVAQVSVAMPFIMLGPIGEDRFTDYEHIVPCPLPGALDEPFLGEFEIAPSNAIYTLPTGGRAFYRMARTLDPRQAQSELAAAVPASELRKAWLIGDEWNFSGQPTAADGAWGVYYAWTQIYSPAKRGMGIELSAAAPCIYVWINDRLNIVRRCPDEPGWDVGISTSQGGLHFIEGWNRLFLKVLMRRGDAFSMRFIHHPPRPAAEKYINDLRFELMEKQ